MGPQSRTISISKVVKIMIELKLNNGTNLDLTKRFKASIINMFVKSVIPRF